MKIIRLKGESSDHGYHYLSSSITTLSTPITTYRHPSPLIIAHHHLSSPITRLIIYKSYPLAELKCSYNDIQKVAH
ncbi:hypothetical protein, partial [Prevotella denticola]|uniref:hypothetical protein n=1 Tax=Prevotella denticola TaxID=28129 RepID=UPI0028DBB918